MFSTNTRMDFSGLSQTVASNVQKMSSQVSEIERMVGQIGTAADSTELRERLHHMTHFIHNIAKETGEMLKDMGSLPTATNPTEQRQQKLLQEKLRDQFTRSLTAFQKVQKTAATKERQSFVRARANSSNTTSQWNPFENDPSQKPTQQPQPISQTQVVLQVEEDVDLQSLRERESAIRNLEADILDVNQIFKDLAVLVHEQGEMVDTIENNVDNAHVHVQDGAKQLADARQYQSKARKKMVCIIATLVVAAVVLFLIIYFSVKK